MAQRSRVGEFTGGNWWHHTDPTISVKEIKTFRQRPLTERIKLSSNENPFGSSEKIRQAMILNFDEACRYPFSHSEELSERIALEEGVSKNHVVLTGGSTESLKAVGLTYL